MMSSNAEKENIIFIDKVEDDVFLSPQILWRIEKSQFEILNSLETPTLNFFETRFTLQLYRTYERVEVYLNIVQTPNRLKNINFSIICGWKSVQDTLSYQQCQNIVVSDVPDKRNVKIWTILCPLTLKNGEGNIFKEDWFYFVFSVLPNVNLKDVESELNANSSYKGSFIDSPSKDFRKLLNSSRESDIVLKCGEKSIPAHKVILSCRSDVFQKIFNGSSKDNTLNVTDVDSSVFEDFICYIYTGDVLIPDIDFASNLYEAALRYNLKCLQIRCVRLMKYFIMKSPIYEASRRKRSLYLYQLNENICKSLLFADKYQENDLKQCVGNWISKNRYILGTEQWTKFSQKNSNLALEILTLIVSSAKVL